jgi:ubiquinone/menaquinone biosynthesis C-methylase UbiE
MEVEEYARIARVEDDHWWYRNTRALMADFLAPWLGTDQTILDAGCGPGGNGAWLADHGRVIGADIASDALAFVRAGRPETTPVRATIDALPFASGSFDIAVAITVVTCVRDDHRAVREMARVVRPGGAVLLIEPAFRALRRAHDKTVHSLHRYRRTELADLMQDAGLRVQRATYVYWFLAAPAAVLAASERLRPHTAANAGSDVERRSLDAVFARLAERERGWLSRHDMPLGTSVAIVATRDDS